MHFMDEVVVNTFNVNSKVKTVAMNIVKTNLELINRSQLVFGASHAFFYDGIVKGEYAVNSNNKLSVTGYRSYDK